MSGTTWEDVYRQPFDIMERTRLDNGWLYRNRLVMSANAQNPADYHWQVSTSYVADAAAAPLDQPTQQPARTK
jgi:hypothetical protein